MCKPYPLETRKAALEMYRDGVPVEEIITKTDVSHTCIYNWVEEASLPHRRKTVKKPDSLSAINSADIASLSLTEKKALVDGFKASKNKSAFAIEHSIPRSTLYNWCKIDDFIQDYQHKTINIHRLSGIPRTVKLKFKNSISCLSCI